MLVKILTPFIALQFFIHAFRFNCMRSKWNRSTFIEAYCFLYNSRIVEKFCWKWTRFVTA